MCNVSAGTDATTATKDVLVFVPDCVMEDLGKSSFPLLLLPFIASVLYLESRKTLEDVPVA